LLTPPFSNRYSWPILTCIITSSIMFFSSATAHLMHQKSHYCHMTCFLCDFAGISFNGFGAAFMQTYMCSPLWYFRFIEPYLMPLIGIQSALCLLFNCIAQTKYKRPYPPIKRFMQFAPCGILWMFTLLPLLLSAIGSDSSSQTLHIHYKQHLMHVTIFILGAVFFALDFPQRFFPGRIDFFGQGHHLFHMCIFFVVMLQINGCYNDYVSNKDLIAASRTAPSALYCFVSLLAMVFYYAFVIINFNRMVCHNFDEHGNLVKKEQVKKLKQD
jgi:hypothetical protein